MLIDKKSADVFLSRYKAILAFLNGGTQPDGIEAYGRLRPLIFQRIDEIERDITEIVGHDFVNAIKSGVYGNFIYLKKYQKGYVLQNIDTGSYYQVAALTTPLEELVGEYTVIDTAIIPYANKLVCDGLVLSHRLSIGRTMAKEIRDGYWLAKRDGKVITKGTPGRGVSPYI